MRKLSCTSADRATSLAESWSWDTRYGQTQNNACDDAVSSQAGMLVLPTLRHTNTPTIPVAVPMVRRKHNQRVVFHVAKGPGLCRT